MEAGTLVTLDIDRAPVEAALTWPARATALVVGTADQYTGAAELLKGIKALRAQITETFGPHISRAFAAHKALVAEQKAAEAPLATAEATIKAKLIVYDTEQERVRREEERRIAELARQDEERRRLDEAAAMEREAQATSNVDLQAEAEALISAPVEAPVISVAKTTPVVSGIAYTTRWSAQVIDLKALIAFVAAHDDYTYLLEPAMPHLNKLVQGRKADFTMPGVKAISTRTVAAGR